MATAKTEKVEKAETPAEAQGVIPGAPQQQPMPSGGAFGTPPVKVKTYPALKVRAIKDGYYGDKLRRTGDVFLIDGTPLADVIAREVDNMPPINPIGLPVTAPGSPSLLTKRQQLQLDAQNKKASRIDHAGVERPAAFSANWMEVVDPKTPEKITSSNEVIRQHHDDTLAGRTQPGIQTDVDVPTGDADVLK